MYRSAIRTTPTVPTCIFAGSRLARRHSHRYQVIHLYSPSADYSAGIFSLQSNYPQKNCESCEPKSRYICNFNSQPSVAFLLPACLILIYENRIGLSLLWTQKCWGLNTRTKCFRTQNPFGLSTVCRVITASGLVPYLRHILVSGFLPKNVHAFFVHGLMSLRNWPAPTTCSVCRYLQVITSSDFLSVSSLFEFLLHFQNLYFDLPDLSLRGQEQKQRVKIKPIPSVIFKDFTFTLNPQTQCIK